MKDEPEKEEHAAEPSEKQKQPRKDKDEKGQNDENSDDDKEGDGKGKEEDADDKDEDGKDEKKGEGGGDDKGGEKKKPSKKKFIIIGSVLFVMALAVGLFFYIRGRGKEETDDAYVTSHVHQVSARITGTVTDVLVDDNQQVKKGEPIIKLDPRDYEVALQKAQAQVAEAQARVLQAKTTVLQAQAQLSQAQAQVSQSQAQVTRAGAQLEVASINYNRNTSLFQKDVKAVARADVDTTKANFDVAQGDFDAARAGMEAAVANKEAVAATGKSSEAQVAVAEAAVKTAEAGVHDAELQLSYTSVLAPVDGRVSRKTVEAGQRLQPGQALLALVQNDVWVVANFKETQLGQLEVGQRVEIRIDAFKKHPFEGKIDSFQAGSGATFALLPPDNATGNFTKIVQRVPVKIVFNEDSIKGFEGRVVPGLSAAPVVFLERK